MKGFLSLSPGVCCLVSMLPRACLPLLLIAAHIIGAQAQSGRILSLTFEGNKIINTNRLRSEMRSCREGGVFQPDALNNDLDSLRRIYQDEGFMQAKVGPPSVASQGVPGKEPSVAITIPVFEGPLFTTGEVKVLNAHAFDPHTLMMMCPLQTGQPFSRQKITDWLEKIIDGYHTMGYLRFNANIKENLNEKRRVVDCILECQEGNTFKVRKIIVEGDETVDRSDFRRHLLVGEGGLFNPEMVFLSLQFLNQMGKYKPISESDVEVRIDDATSSVEIVYRVTSAKKPPPGKGSS
jgi:outer membrane protein insertion porin family